jgi:uncharacterized membrane protein
MAEEDSVAVLPAEGETEPNLSAPGAVGAIRITQTMSYAGPIPHPELFAQFEEVCPGAADRILTMAEEEGGHRRKLERREQTQQWISGLFGQGIAGTIVILLLCFATKCILAGKVWAGAAFAGLLLAGDTDVDRYVRHESASPLSQVRHCLVAKDGVHQSQISVLDQAKFLGQLV